MHRMCGVAMMLLVMAAQVASAGPLSDFFDRKSRGNGPDRVVELLSTLQNDADASKRARAADELGHMDGQAYPEIVPALSNVLQKDSSASVRKDAATALGHLKPPTREAADALDQAIANDTSPWVRLHARTARLGYHAPAPPAPPAQPAPMPTKTTTNASPLLSKPLPSPSAPGIPPTATKPLPTPPPSSKSGNPMEPGKFLPDPMPLPPETKNAKELPPEPKNDNGGAILAAPPKKQQ